MTVLRYKDYQGAVTFEDGHLVIQILHIDDLITTECDRASDAQKAFEELVEDYLATCAELKKEPSKPFKGSFNIRISPALHKRVAMVAAERDESLNALVIHALETYLVAEHAPRFRTPSFAQSIFRTLEANRSAWEQIWERREGVFRMPRFPRALVEEIAQDVNRSTVTRRLMTAEPNVPWVNFEEGER
jgi:predicted HicB family RNase H-like nuclease